MTNGVVQLAKTQQWRYLWNIVACVAQYVILNTYVACQELIRVDKNVHDPEHVHILVHCYAILVRALHARLLSISKNRFICYDFILYKITFHIIILYN